MAGEVGTDLIESFCLQKTKTFNLFTTKSCVFAIYLLKDTLQEGTNQVICIN